MSKKKRPKKEKKEESQKAVATDEESGTEELEEESHDDAASEPADETPPETGDDSVPTFEELARLSTEAREMRSLAQRKQAEFENYRKRVERERSETVKYAAAEIVKEILPVLDNLERAIEASKSGSDSQLREGVEIIYKQFRDTLSKQGLTEVDAYQAPFDPHVHEAVTRVETDEYPEGTVVEVFQKGYLFKDRLLRPSMVSVAQPGAAEEASGEDREDEDEDEAVRQED